MAGMNKQFRKALSSLVPGSLLKEKIKLKYYQYNKPADTAFALQHRSAGIAYLTRFRQHKLLTWQALYHVAADFDNYQHFYSIQNGDTVIDAGAHMGHLSLLFSQQAGAEGAVFAFEPDKENRKALLENLALNTHLPANINLLETLLWKEATTVEFFEGNSEASSTKYAPANAVAMQKPATSIDVFVQAQQLRRLDFIKMDIEGAEIEAMQGCVETLKHFRPNLAIASDHVIVSEPAW